MPCVQRVSATVQDLLSTRNFPAPCWELPHHHALRRPPPPKSQLVYPNESHVGLDGCEGRSSVKRHSYMWLQVPFNFVRLGAALVTCTTRCSPWRPCGFTTKDVMFACASFPHHYLQQKTGPQHMSESKQAIDAVLVSFLCLVWVELPPHARPLVHPRVPGIKTACESARVYLASWSAVHTEYNHLKASKLSVCKLNRTIRQGSGIQEV